MMSDLCQCKKKVNKKNRNASFEGHVFFENSAAMEYLPVKTIHRWDQIAGPFVINSFSCKKLQNIGRKRLTNFL